MASYYSVAPYEVSCVPRLELDGSVDVSEGTIQITDSDESQGSQIMARCHSGFTRKELVKIVDRILIRSRGHPRDGAFYKRETLHWLELEHARQISDRRFKLLQAE